MRCRGLGHTLALFAVGAAALTQAQADDGLRITGEQLDAAMFSAYNACELEAFGDFIAEDVEFFHDKTGLMTGRQALVDALRQNICHKVRREILPGTLQTFPMDNYGLVQLGMHRFCTAGTTDCQGVARFVHLWRRTGDVWQATRIISYDHQPLIFQEGH